MMKRKTRLKIYFVLVILSAIYRLYENDIDGFILSMLVLSMFLLVPRSNVE